MGRVQERLGMGGIEQVLLRGRAHIEHAARRQDGRLHKALRRLLVEGAAGARQRLDLQRRSEEHTSELQSPCNIVCRLLLATKKWTLPLVSAPLAPFHGLSSLVAWLQVPDRPPVAPCAHVGCNYRRVQSRASDLVAQDRTST